MYEDLFNADQNLEEQRKILTIQKKLLANAEAALKRRQEELIGSTDAAPPKADGPPLPTEFAKGLIAAIEEEQVRRNATQSDVNRLRDQLEQSRQRLTKLIEGNQQLEKKLPRADY